MQKIYSKKIVTILSAFLMLAVPVYAFGADIAYQNSIAIGSGSGSFDVGAGSNRLLMAFIRTSNGTAITDVQYNSVSLTKITTASGQGCNTARFEWWYLVNPSSGSNTLAVTGGTNPEMTAYAFNNANQDSTVINATVNQRLVADSTVTPTVTNTFLMGSASRDAGCGGSFTSLDTPSTNPQSVSPAGSFTGQTARSSAVQADTSDYTIGATTSGNGQADQVGIVLAGDTSEELGGDTGTPMIMAMTF